MSEEQDIMPFRSMNSNIRQAIGFQDQHSSALIKHQLDTSVILNELRLKLSGKIKYKDSNGIWVEEQIRQPLMSDIGIADMLNLADSVANKEVILSNFSEIEIKNIMLAFMCNVADMLYTKEHVYRISKDRPLSSAEFHYIYNIMRIFSHSTLNKAKNGTFLSFLKATVQTKEAQVITPERKGGWLGRFFDNKGSGEL